MEFMQLKSFPRKQWLSSPRFLAGYSGLLTVVFAVTVLSGFTTRESFDQITVQRINLVEPDGTLRMILSNKALSPGIFVKGTEYLPGHHNSAGMIFLNDEGTENGGLSFTGYQDSSGNQVNSGLLSFDAYQQDETIAMSTRQNNGQSAKTVAMADEPSWSFVEYFQLLQQIQNLPPAQQQAALQQFFQTHPQAQLRLVLARNQDTSTSLQLKDIQGNDRLVLKVDPSGNPHLQFLDANGNVISQLP